MASNHVTSGPDEQYETPHLDSKGDGGLSQPRTRAVVVIPTYNEKDNIAHLVERVDESLSGYSYELIVVDDNSPDGTS